MPASRPCEMCGEAIGTDRYSLPLPPTRTNEFYDWAARQWLWGHVTCGQTRGLEPRWPA
jgi:hypothetical protein